VGKRKTEGKEDMLVVPKKNSIPSSTASTRRTCLGGGCQWWVGPTGKWGREVRMLVSDGSAGVQHD